MVTGRDSRFRVSIRVAKRLTVIYIRTESELNIKKQQILYSSNLVLIDQILYSDGVTVNMLKNNLAF